MNPRSFVVALIALVALSHRAVAQQTTIAASAIGVWRGTSICLVRPSSCHDEVVVYRITGWAGARPCLAGRAHAR